MHIWDLKDMMFVSVSRIQLTGEGTKSPQCLHQVETSSASSPQRAHRLQLLDTNPEETWDRLSVGSKSLKKAGQTEE